MDNVKIDLSDLLHRILHKWYFIAVVMLACGLLFEGIGYARAYFNYRQEVDGMEEEQEKNKADQYFDELEEDEGNLTEREISEVQIAAASYQVYMAQYEEDLLYCQDSIKMQLDSNKVPVYIMHYVISSSDSDRQTVELVAAAALEMVKDEETCEEIRTALGWDTELGYIDNLISVETGDTFSINDETLELELSDVKQVTIEIIAPEKEDCQIIAEILKYHIEQETAELQDNYGEFEWILLSETYHEKAYSKLNNDQNNRLNSLNTLHTAISSLTSGMSDRQKEYYYALIEYNIAENNEEEVFAPEEKEAAALVSPPGIFRWKFILLGLVLGAILACGYLLLRYIFSKNLRVKDDMGNAFHIPSLGYVPVNDKDKQFTREERMEMICAGIRIAIQKADLKNVYLTGTAGDVESSQVMEQIEEALIDSRARVSNGRDVACDPVSLERMTASDGVVFIERVDHSPYIDIQKEVEYCQMYDVPVIGSVVIE